MEQCDAIVIMHDDRWGGIKTRCELGMGHEGDHQVTMNACEPLATLSWKDN